MDWECQWTKYIGKFRGSWRLDGKSLVLIDFVTLLVALGSRACSWEVVEYDEF